MNRLLAVLFVLSYLLGTLFGAEDVSPTFVLGGKTFVLANVEVAKDGVVNEYVPKGETLDHWTSYLALRYYPGARNLDDPVAAWIKTVRPRSLEDSPPSEDKTDPDSVLVEAWLGPSDGSYIEVDYCVFRREDSVAGVKGYQYAQRKYMNGDGGDPTEMIQRKQADFAELQKLRLSVLETGPKAADRR